MDYAGLQVAVGGALNRGDLYGAVPTFITLCEAQVGRELRHWRMIDRAEATLANEYETLPDDFLEMISVRIDGSSDPVLDNIAPDAIAERKARERPITGKPDSYALVGASIQSFPAPDQGYPIIVTYYEQIPALSTSNTTNWLLTQFPDLYLYGALGHAAAYLSPDPRIAIWRGLYDEALASAKAEGVKGLVGARLTPHASNVV